MALDPAQFLNLLRELIDKNPRTRADHADAVTDLRAAMSPAESHALASVLAALAVCEPDGTAREAQLHALAELHEWDQSTPDALHLLRRLDRTTLAGSEIEYADSSGIPSQIPGQPAGSGMTSPNPLPPAGPAR